MKGERKERDYPPKTKKEKKDEKGKEKRIGLRERNSKLSRLFNEPTARGETRNQLYRPPYVNRSPVFTRKNPRVSETCYFIRFLKRTHQIPIIRVTSTTKPMVQIVQNLTH